MVQFIDLCLSCLRADLYAEKNKSGLGNLWDGLRDFKRRIDCKFCIHYQVYIQSFFWFKLYVNLSYV